MYVYICSLLNGRFYCGITNNITRRWSEHNKKGKGYVQRVGANKIVYIEVVKSRKEARAKEVSIKKYGVSKFVKFAKITKNQNIICGSNFYSIMHQKY